MPSTFSCNKLPSANTGSLTGTSIVIQLGKSGVDQGILERGFICIKVWEFALLIFLSFFLNIP